MEPWQLASNAPFRRGEVDRVRRDAVALAIALVALNALDLIVTNFGIQNLRATELNPVVSPIIMTAWAPLLKIGIPLGIVAMATQIRHRVAVTALRLVVVVYLVVVIIGVGQVALYLT